MARLWAITICLLYLFPPNGALADAAGSTDGLEFVPFVGYRFGGSFDERSSQRLMDVDDRGSWGFTLSSYISPTTRYEFLYSHQDTRLSDWADPQDAFNLDIHYLQLGGTVDFTQERIVPFFSGGIGMTHLSPGHAGYGNETRFSLSVGGGLKWYPTEHLGIRFEMRGYGTLLDSDGSLFCDGGCQLELSGNLFPQFETNLGLIFRF